MIHGMACQDVTIGHTCFPRKGSLRLTNTTVGGDGRGGGGDGGGGGVFL